MTKRNHFYFYNFVCRVVICLFLFIYFVSRFPNVITEGQRENRPIQVELGYISLALKNNCSKSKLLIDDIDESDELIYSGAIKRYLIVPQSILNITTTLNFLLIFFLIT